MHPDRRDRSPTSSSCRSSGPRSQRRPSDSLQRADPAATACAAAGARARRFPPGSEWLYVKLFTGTATRGPGAAAGRARRRVVAHGGGADQWFFIRYGDPDWHLRLRIHGAPDRLLHETLPLLHRVTAPLLDTGQLWRVQLDTYEREVERYGGEAGICLAERVFHADSDAVLAVVRQLTGDAGAELRWRVALRGIDLLFDDLGLTLDQKRAIARRARRGYGSEFGANGDFSREVSRRYRQERASVEALLDPHRDPPSELAASLRGTAPAIHRARAGHAGSARPSGRGTAFRRPPRAGDEPRAHARQPDAALCPAGPGTRPLRDCSTAPTAHKRPGGPDERLGQHLR